MGCRRLPGWIGRPIPEPGKRRVVENALADGGLQTVCSNACCPNMGECFAAGTATFMILGCVCTRDCSFCAVQSGRPAAPDPHEPAAVAKAVDRMELDYAVITSVTRDDLADGGASHFAATIRAIRAVRPGCRIEILTPDFGGSRACIETVVRAEPDVYNHNLETVPRLYARVRPEADFERSLEVLALAKQLDPSLTSKSGLMVGLGETREELLAVLRGLRRVDCDGLTVGQYLAPRGCLPVERYLPPEEFEEIRTAAKGLGFRMVASGPLVRSSYKAAALAAGVVGRRSSHSGAASCDRGPLEGNAGAS